MLFRCNDHTDGGWPQKREGGYTYVGAIRPVGDSGETAAICGRDECEEPALIFLDDRQFWRFQYEDQRVFGLHSRADASVKVTDEIRRRREDLARPKEYGPDEDGNWPEYPNHDSAANI